MPDGIASSEVVSRSPRQLRGLVLDIASQPRPTEQLLAWSKKRPMVDHRLPS
ncbi:hypothetical protein AKJ09_00244 [Labilithrix luteola]|uniref:Uncharacterized protein n=1 Tax=Labilithrix luteola TaxID=1391654 RepID=A0A0K1PJ82_9BACT|nr:hypothetical protein AKJ09_00244 [Labilithrix luteola]